MTEHACNCTGPGRCPRWGRYMTQRMVLVCQGDTSVPEEERQKWLAAWQAEQVSRQPPPSPPPDSKPRLSLRELASLKRR